MSCVVGCVYFCKIFFDFGVNAFVTNFFPTSTAVLFPTSKAFFAPSLATLLPTSRAEDAICLAALLVKIKWFYYFFDPTSERTHVLLASPPLLGWLLLLPLAFSLYCFVFLPS